MTRTAPPASERLPHPGAMRESPGSNPAFEEGGPTNVPDAADVRPSIARELMAAIARRRLLVAAATMGGIVVGVLAAGILPEQHDASASLYIGFDRAHIVRDDVTGTTPWIPFRLDTVMLGELEILRSPALRAAVLDTVGIKRLEGVPDARGASDASGTPQDRRDRALIDLERGLEVTRSVDSPVIRIAYRHPDPEVARDVVAAAIGAYRTQRAALFSEGERPEVFAELAAEGRQRVEAAEAALDDFRARAGLLSEDQTLELDLKLARTAYEQIVTRRDEVRLSAALDSSGVTSIRTLQPPVVTPYATSISPAVLGAVGGVLGLAAGALLASLAELVSRSWRARAHARRTANEKVHG